MNNSDGIKREMKYCKCENPNEWDGDNYCQDCDGLIEAKTQDAPASKLKRMVSLPSGRGYKIRSRMGLVVGIMFFFVATELHKIYTETPVADAGLPYLAMVIALIIAVYAAFEEKSNEAS